MDLKDIQELIKFVAKSGATEVELEIDNVKISIKSPPKKRRGSTDEVPLIINQEQSQIAPTGVIPIQPIQQNIIPVETPSSAISTEIKESTDHLVTIKSSMIGTFYRSSSPEKPSFVNVSSSAKYSLIAVLFVLACAKYANLPADTGVTLSSCSNEDTSLSIAVVGDIVSPALSNLYCAVSENNNKLSLNPTEFLSVLTCVPEAAISIGSVSKTCVDVVAK